MAEPVETRPRRREPWARLWPFLATAVFAAWMTRPILKYDPMVFSRRLFVDGIMGPWYYEHMARGIAQGQIPHQFTPFDWPCSRDTLSLPNAWDAVLATPLHLLLPWPASWSATMAVLIAASGLGLAWLAASIGARSFAVTLAGGLGVCILPLWHELQEGRVNAAWIGVVFGATAALIDLARAAGDPAARRGALALRAAVAAALGALALAIYPPYVVMVAPAGALLIAPHLVRGVRPALLVGAALAAGIGLAAPELHRIATFMDTFYVRGHTCAGALTPCPPNNGHAVLLGLALLRPDPVVDVLHHSSAALGAWALLPLLVLARGRRLALTAVALTCAILAWLSLGPCPAVSVGPAQTTMATLPRWLHEVWCRVWDVHRMERFLIPALGLAAVAAARGVEGARRRLGAAGQLVLAGACAGAVAHGAWILRGDLFSGLNWSRSEIDEVTRALATAPPSVIAVLPYDGQGQFLTDLYAPGHRYVNPFELDRISEPRDEVGAWLGALATWQAPASTPDAAALAASGIDRVYFDPARCATSNPRERRICDPGLASALAQGLGEPRRLGAGVLEWRISAEPGARAAAEARCEAR